ncbi:MAG: AAA family ATPase [Leptolyngbya sp. BL-A-14]
MLADLHHLCHRVQFAEQVNDHWGFAAGSPSYTSTIALFAGPSGTGKTLAARAIAQTLQSSLICVDLTQVPLNEVPQLLQTLAVQAPTVLLLKAAHIWLSRTALLNSTVVHQFLALRQQHNSITLLSTHYKQSVAAPWRRQMIALLDFPLPDHAARLKLWQQAFPAQVSLDQDIDWQWLAQHVGVSGGEISAIARDAAFYAAATAETRVTMQHLLQACKKGNGMMSRSRKREAEEH